MLDLIGIAALLGVSAYTAHKARRAHLKSFEILEEVKRISATHLVDVTQQLQALDLLRYKLKLERPLPFTRGWAASPDFLLILVEHVARARPSMIVECSSGTSTIVLARMAQILGTGHVYSLEHEGEFAEKTRLLLTEFHLNDYATVLHAPLSSYTLRGESWPWYDMSQLPDRAIDLLVVDGPPMLLRKYSRYPAGPLLGGRLSAAGSIFLDDASRDDERQIVRWWTEEFPSLAAKEHYAEKGCVELSR